MGVKEQVAPVWRAASRLRVALVLVFVLLVFGSATDTAARAEFASAVAGAGPRAGYALRPSCEASPHGARCLALRVVAASSRRRVPGASRDIAGAGGAHDLESRVECENTHKHPVLEGCDGLTPEDLWSAYGLTRTTAPSAQTVAIVDAFDDPTIEKDLQKYSKTFELLPCTKHKPCLTKVNQNGEAANLPAPNAGWAEEISIDVEMVHAICQNCHILLVEAKSGEDPADLEAAEETAARLSPNEISNSWVEPEPPIDTPAFDHPGIVITAGSGDEGLLNWVPGSPEEGKVDYPASSPNVVAVGGTRLEDAGGTWTSTVWNGEGVGKEKGATGSGCSEHYEAPYWQLELPDWSTVGCSRNRAVADIAAVADPNTGVAVYDTAAEEGEQPPYWEKLGGTSVAAPIIAAMFALAGGSDGVEYPARTLYENAASKPESVKDVVSGSSGFCGPPPTPEGLTRCSLAELGKSCSDQAICVAGPGYDGPSGLGTPAGIGLFQATGKEPKKPQTAKFRSKAPSPARLYGPKYVVTAESTSSLAVSLESLTPSVCELRGSTVSYSTVGTCTIEARQGGNDEYQPASPVQQSFSVEREVQKVVFGSNPPPAPTAGEAPYEVSATASSGLAVTFSSVTASVCTVEEASVSFLSAGTCTIDATQPGDAEWEPAAVAQQTMLVGPAPEHPALQTALPGVPARGALGFNVSGSSSSGSSAQPDSAFKVSRLLAHHKTGAITFSVALADRGSVSWRLTFAPRDAASLRVLRGGCRKDTIRVAGSCHVSPAMFAEGRLQSTGAGSITVTVHPGALASRALAAVRGSARGILVTLALTVQSASSGRPASQTHSLADYVDWAHGR